MEQCTLVVHACSWESVHPLLWTSHPEQSISQEFLYLVVLRVEWSCTYLECIQMCLCLREPRLSGLFDKRNYFCKLLIYEGFLFLLIFARFFRLHSQNHRKEI